MDEQEVKVIPFEEVGADEPTVEYPPIRRVKVSETVCSILSALLTAVSVSFFVATAIPLFRGVQFNEVFVTQVALGRFVGGVGKVQYMGEAPAAALGNLHRPTLQFSDSTLPGSDSVQAPQSPSVEDYTITLNNETPYKPDMTEILNRPRAIPALSELYATYGNSSPVVLIIHTHGSEAYADCADSSYRTDDKSKNVVAIGRIIADKLNGAGIATIHCDTLFDAEDFNMAYYNASLEIRKTLEEYPSISYIIDVHRDSVELPDGTQYPLKAEANGHIAAQLMFVVGTDHGGSGHTGWRDNLSLAARLQYSIGKDTPALMRNVNLRSASFNEQYTKGSLILEVGSSGNSLEEAKISADIFAETLIREIKG